MDRLPDGSALSAAELERRMVHVLLDRLLATGRIAVVDRTVLREVLAEHALNLSGLVSDAASDNEPAIRATDYLVLVKASGFTISKRRFRDIPEIGDSPFLVRGTACCIVHMEIVSSRTGEVVWTDSEKGTASSLVEQESEIDTPGLLVTCATEALSRTVERLRCISLP